MAVPARRVSFTVPLCGHVAWHTLLSLPTPPRPLFFVSSCKPVCHRNNKCCQRRLALQDLSDDQWRHFRSGLPALTVLFTGNACVSHILRTQFVKRKLRVRTFFYAAAGSLFVGESVDKVVDPATLHIVLAKASPECPGVQAICMVRVYCLYSHLLPSALSWPKWLLARPPGDLQVAVFAFVLESI